MPPVRVILANQPRLLREMLNRAISRAPGLTVVREIADPADLARVAVESQAHWVIVSLWPAGEAPPLVKAILAANPAVCVLGIAADIDRVKIRCGESEERVLQDPSLDGLLATLRHRGVTPTPALPLQGREL